MVLDPHTAVGVGGGARARSRPIPRRPWWCSAPPIRPSSPTPSSAPPASAPPCRRISPTCSTRPRALHRAAQRRRRRRTASSASALGTRQRSRRVTASTSPHCRPACASSPTRCRISRRPRSASGSASARATRPRPSTACRISSNTWRSRARAAARRGASPRRSRAPAATSTPRPRPSRPPITPACWPPDTDLALDILADILTDSAFDPAEVEREKEVVLQEIGAVEDVPDDLVFELFTATAYPDQPIGRPILGTPKGVSRFDRDRRRPASSARRYGADQTIVAAAGAVDHDRLVDRCGGQRFAGLTEEPAPPAAPTARYRGGDIRLKRRLEQAHIVVGFEGPSFHDAGPLRGAYLLARGRRRHVVAAVPDGARGARPRLYDQLASTGPTRTPACSASTPRPRPATSPT